MCVHSSAKKTRPETSDDLARGRDAGTHNNESKEDVEERKKLPPRIDGTRLDLFMGGGSSARVDERLTAAAAQEDDDEGGDNDDNFSRWSSRDGRNGNNKRAAGVTRVDSRAVGRQKKAGGSYGKSIEFLRKTLGETHTLVGGGTGVKAPFVGDDCVSERPASSTHGCPASSTSCWYASAAVMLCCLSRA